MHKDLISNFKMLLSFSTDIVTVKGLSCCCFCCTEQAKEVAHKLDTLALAHLAALVLHHVGINCRAEMTLTLLDVIVRCPLVPRKLLINSRDIGVKVVEACLKCSRPSEAAKIFKGSISLFPTFDSWLVLSWSLVGDLFVRTVEPPMRHVSDERPPLFWTCFFFFSETPKGGQECPVSTPTPCLEFQGCRLIPLWFMNTELGYIQHQCLGTVTSGKDFLKIFFSLQLSGDCRPGNLSENLSVLIKTSAADVSG